MSEPVGDHLRGALADLFGSVSAADVFGPVERTEDRVVIPAAAIERAGGFGFGSGSDADDNGGGGGGGGGSVMGRPVAVIEVGPDGVEVHPVVDVTKVAIAALGVFLAMRRVRRRA